MTEPCRELDHLAPNVSARPIPFQHGSHRKGVAKIVDTRTAAVPKIQLRLSQPDLLAYMREVVARTAIGKTVPLAGHKEGFRLTPEQPVPLATVAFQPVHDARIQRQQPLLAKLALPDMKYAGFDIEIGRVQTESFADPKSGHGDQPEQRRAVRPRMP